MNALPDFWSFTSSLAVARLDAAKACGASILPRDRGRQGEKKNRRSGGPPFSLSADGNSAFRYWLTGIVCYYFGRL